jgi:hypothetical protein
VGVDIYQEIENGTMAYDKAVAPEPAKRLFSV